MRLKKILETDEADALLDQGFEADRFVGRFLRWHNGALCPFVVLRNGAVGARISLKCHVAGCRKRHITYLVTGLHSGAWCYTKNRRGQYEGNLRDEVFACKDHRGQGRGA